MIKLNNTIYFTKLSNAQIHYCSYTKNNMYDNSNKLAIKL